MKLRSFLLPCLVAAAASTSGCGIYRGHTRFETLTRADAPPAAVAQKLNVYFLGTGSIYLQGPELSLLADPFFTNPFPWSLVPLFRIDSDAELVAATLKRLPGIEKLQSVLVTHGHYDHAMDLPSVMELYPAACIYGSSSLKNALGSPASPTYEDISAWAQDPPQWHRIAPRVRVAVMHAQHFKHLGPIFYGSGMNAAGSAPPHRLWNWRVGDTYSFVIDILAESPQQGIAFRIFYMPSAATHPRGTPPDSILHDGKPFDLAILGAAQMEKDKTYPGKLLKLLAPKAIMLVHWDNFVDRYRTTRAMNYRVSPQRIATRINDAIGTSTPVYWPERGAAKSFRVDVAPPVYATEGDAPAPPCARENAG